MNSINTSLIRLLGILIISNFIIYINFILQSVNEILNQHQQGYVIAMLLFSLPFVIGTLMILYPNQFSVRLNMIEYDDIEYNLKDILGTCIVLLGVFFIVNSIISIMIEVIYFLVAYLKTNTTYSISDTSLSHVFGNLFKIVIGFIFTFRGIKISKYILNK